MKAMVLEGKKKIELKDIEKPTPGLNDVIVRIKATSICGTDLHLYQGLLPAKVPMVLGHEASGEITEVGANVKSAKVGEKVYIDPILTCGECRLCTIGRYNVCENRRVIGHDIAEGTFCEYVRVPETNVFAIPKTISFEEAALIETTSVAVHSVKRARIDLGDNVAILGAGPIGLLAIQAARIAGAGATIVTEIQPNRIKLADQLGADEVIDASQGDVEKKIMELTNGVGPDVVMEVIGRPDTVEQAIRLVRKGGRVVVVGLTTIPAKLEILLLTRRELEIIGSNAYMMKVERVGEMVGSGKINVKPLITHHMPLEKLPEALALLERNEGIKMMLKL
jgi:L-iditol 2-dehydrogenase